MNSTTEIAQLVVRERQSRVRGLTDELRDCYHEEATVTTSQIRGSASAFWAGGGPRAAQPKRITGRVAPPVVHHKGSRAVVELPSTTTHWLTVNQVEAELASFMRLLYRVERRDGIWRISSMVAINEGDSLIPAVPGTELGITPQDVAGLRVSYRFLAYTRSLQGETVSPDLYGTDRPEGVDQLYADAFRWLDQATVISRDI